MKANSVQNFKIRKNYYTFELEQKTNKFLSRQLLNSLPNKKQKRCLYVMMKYLNNKNSLKYSKTQVKNQCVITGRNNSINKHYSLSRITLRNLLSYGIIPGYKKAAW